VQLKLNIYAVFRVILAEISIAKHRNGEIGMKRLAFIGQYTKFANLALGTGS